MHEVGTGPHPEGGHGPDVRPVQPLGGDQAAPGDIASKAGGGGSEKGLANDAAQAVRPHQDIRLQTLARGEDQGRGPVPGTGDHRLAQAKGDLRLGLAGLSQYGDQVRPVHVEVGKAVSLPRCLTEGHPADLLTPLPAPRLDSLGPEGEGGEARFQAQVEQHTGGIGRDLESRPHLVQRRRLLDHRH